MLRAGFLLVLVELRRDITRHAAESEADAEVLVVVGAEAAPHGFGGQPQRRYGMILGRADLDLEGLADRQLLAGDHHHAADAEVDHAAQLLQAALVIDGDETLQAQAYGACGRGLIHKRFLVVSWRGAPAIFVVIQSTEL